ncbi:TAFII28-like protein [Corchorus capsularis]|uniref:TAFII28-like protein n=1 Tax=Corchorus capsularis TaxID=210143 RepID=A0A1R3JHC1_COCAP|nr:TAFII28-like protein [Corchorus capsularis]
MNKSKDPFEAALEEQEDSPPDSPIAQDELDTQTPIQTQNQAPAGRNILFDDDDYDEPSTDVTNPSHPSSDSTPMLLSANVNANVSAGTTAAATTKNKEYDDDEEEENVDVELSKFPSSADPTKMAKMQAILSQFTEDQMSRYESFRRSALQKSNMRRLLVSITGSQKVSLPMTIVVCGIAKMFVGELVETARMVMTERKESGPIRPCHIREAYRRLKLEGKIPKRSVQRLFR